MIRKNNLKEGIFGNYQTDHPKEFDLYIDNLLIVNMFCARILFFFKDWCEKIVKSGDAQGGITNKYIINNPHHHHHK